MHRAARQDAAACLCACGGSAPAACRHGQCSCEWFAANPAVDRSAVHASGGSAAPACFWQAVRQAGAQQPDPRVARGDENPFWTKARSVTPLRAWTGRFRKLHCPRRARHGRPDRSRQSRAGRLPGSADRAGISVVHRKSALQISSRVAANRHRISRQISASRIACCKTGFSNSRACATGVPHRRSP